MSLSRDFRPGGNGMCAVGRITIQQLWYRSQLEGVAPLDLLPARSSLCLGDDDRRIELEGVADDDECVEGCCALAV